MFVIPGPPLQRRNPGPMNTELVRLCRLPLGVHGSRITALKRGFRDDKINFGNCRGRYTVASALAASVAWAAASLAIGTR